MSDFYDNDFERFLQQQVKQHRMYPSDAVWKGIYKQVHGDKKWPGLYFIAILMVAALSVCTIFMDSTPVIYPKQMAAKTSAAATIAQLDPEKVTSQTIKALNEKQEQLTDVTFVDPAPVVLIADEQPVTANNLFTNSDVTPPTATNSKATVNEANMSQEMLAVNSNVITQTEQSSLANANIASTNAEAKTENKAALPTVKAASEQTTETAETNTPPITVTKTKSSKWQYQVYITPATNFKQTVDRKPSTDQFNGPMVTTFGVDANKVIRYNPGMGIEFGLGGLYDVSKRFTLKAGLQYNIRQYNIEAYDGSYELSSIALVNGAAVNNVPTLAKYRSYGANYNEALLLNKYHQVSLPIGVQYALIKRDKVGINIAYSIQPTYTFSQSAYLLTSDYKSYADGTSMTRKWNINSSLEATLNMTVGDFKWQFGPQLRYQHLSTYTNEYPIKEYLIDYGFKIGFTKTLH
jgi:hypothetical protein